MSVKGLILELMSGLMYAIYMVVFPRMRIRNIPSLKVNFYVFLIAMVMLMAWSVFNDGRIQPIPSLRACLSLFLLGLLPTMLSNVCLIMSLKLLSSEMVATLGAFEPLTAMIVGITVFHEPLTLAVILGFLLITSSVIILVKKG